MDTLTTIVERRALLPLALKVFSRRVQGKRFGFSFNVADRCPIGCHCYWRAQARVKELSNEEMVHFFHERRAEGFVHVTLVGGEPYVRPDALALVTPIMPMNWLVTSGTTPLGWFPNTTHFISIDGADAETHNTVRRSAGLYQRILRHLQQARDKWELPSYIHTVLNAKNYTQIREIVEVWLANGLANGIVFSTMTPIRDAADDDLRLSREQRIEIVDELRRAKREFGDFMLNTQGMIDFLHPDVTQTFTPETCGTALSAASYDAAGNLMKQCILSEKADCTQCGCVITAITGSVLKFPPDWGSLEAAGMLAQIKSTPARI